MTNEEVEVQAEIYAKEKHCKNECRNIPNCWENNIEDCCTDCRKTNEDFIAGAKWGMEHAIEWHKAEELPPMETKYYTINVLTDTQEIAYFDIQAEEWLRDSSSTLIDTPSYWCELPQFKE